MAKFNREKVLRQLEFKRKWRSYSRYVYIAVPCVLCCLLCLYFAYSKFFVSDAQAVIRTTVGDFIYGDVVISAYIDGEYSSTIPGKNDGYVVEKVVCDNDASASWNNDKWGILVINLTKRTKCNVHFKKVVSKVPDIIAQLDTTGKCPTVNADGTVSVTEAEKQYGYLCKAKDAYGDSYYYRGKVTNNYVKFGEWQVRKYFGYYSDTSNAYHMYNSLEECQNASSHNKKCAVGIDIGTPMYWRIIRINGDGTVRVIYDGISAHANGDGSEDKQIGTSNFNDGYRYDELVNLRNYDNAHVGYMYGKVRASYAETHANTNNSTIKTYLDAWYENNIKGTSNEQYVKDNLFCNDRSFSPSNSGTGAGTSPTFYNSATSRINLKCPQQNDAFTVSDTTNGNGALTYGVGLVTADEVILAGGWSSKNVNYYLYSGNYYWTMSPSSFQQQYAYEHYVSHDGSTISHEPVAGGGHGSVILSYGARPVLNLSSDVLKNGNGTASDPYRISSD